MIHILFLKDERVVSTTEKGRVFHTFIVHGTYECWKQLVRAEGQWYKKGLMVLEVLPILVEKTSEGK